ncbi:MAG: hypothetical protein HY975_04350 [Candidatus Kerfeldbacteria bacterium]|nr:hypothetical protein [Candidatus Kerfeldbacteria bacterium]
MRQKLAIPAVIIVIVFAAGAAAWVVWNDAADESIQEPTTTASGIPTAIVEPVGPVPLAGIVQEPDLNRPIKVLASLSDTAAAKAVTRIGELNAELSKDSTLFSSWMELAVNRKLIGDYAATEEIWLYVTQNWAGDPVAYNNLADLYLMALHDNERAEIYLLLAIKKEPTQVIFYENAYSFYRFVKKDLVKAEQILEEGIAKNQTNDAGLKKLLADMKAGG